MAQRKMTGWRIFRLVLLIISIAFAFKAGFRRFHEQSSTSPQILPVKQQDSFVDGIKERQKIEEKLEKLDSTEAPSVLQLKKDGLEQTNGTSDAGSQKMEKIRLHDSSGLVKLRQ